jgi:hypothetical protein
MTTHIELTINGKNIPLSEFPKEFIYNSILGMVSTLKGVDEHVETLTLSIKTKD